MSELELSLFRQRSQEALRQKARRGVEAAGLQHRAQYLDQSDLRGYLRLRPHDEQGKCRERPQARAAWRTSPDQ